MQCRFPIYAGGFAVNILIHGFALSFETKKKLTGVQNFNPIYVLGYHYLIPILLEQQLFDPVSMQHLVIEQMPEHDNYRVMIKRLVHGCFLPFVR